MLLFLVLVLVPLALILSLSWIIKLYNAKIAPRLTARREHKQEVLEAIVQCEEKLRDGEPTALDLLLQKYSDRELAPWTARIQEFEAMQAENVNTETSMRRALAEAYTAWQSSLNDGTLAEQIDKGSELVRQCTAPWTFGVAAPPQRCWPVNAATLEALKQETAAKAQSLCTQLAEQAGNDRSAYFELANLMRKSKSEEGALRHCLRKPLELRGNWPEWTAGYLPEPSLEDFGVGWGAVLPTYQVTAELQLRAANAIQKNDHVEAKLIRAYCFTGDYGYMRSARNNVGDILLAELARLVARYNSEHLEQPTAEPS